MKNLIIIAAIGKNNELGKNNKLIWYLPNDLKFFKKQTEGHSIIMGYNTFKSLPKLLVNRKHIVLTHRKEQFPKEVIVFNEKNDLLKSLNDNDRYYIIGGSIVYQQFINDASEMILTEINEEDDNADTYFPSFDKNEWESNEIDQNEDNGIKYKHLRYIRKK